MKYWLIISLFLGISTCSYSQMVATYDGGTISVAEIREYMMEFADYRGAMLNRYPDITKRDQVVAQKIAYDRLLAINTIKSGVNKRADVQAKLQGAEYELAYNLYLNQYIADTVIITQADAEKRYHERIKTHFTIPEKWTFRYIFFHQSTTKSMEEQTALYSRGTQVLALAKEGNDFSELAKVYSDAVNVQKTGGLYGPVDANQLHPAIDSALRTLQPNQISGLIPIQVGYQIIQLIQYQPSTVLAFADVNLQIQARMKNERIQEGVAAFLADVKKNLQIQTFYDRLDNNKISPDTILLQSTQTTLRYKDILFLWKSYLPRLLRMSRSEKETLLNTFVIRKAVAAIAKKAGIYQTEKFKRLYTLHETDVYAFYEEMEETHKNIQLTTKNFETYYKKHLSNYVDSQQFLTREIILPLPLPDKENLTLQQLEQSRKQTLQKAQDICQQIQSGTSFVALAKKYSSGGSAKDGGILPWMNHFEGGAQFSQALNGLNPGDVSKPITGPKYILILKLDQIRKPQTPPWKTYEFQVKRDYLRSREIEEAQQLQEQYLAKYHYQGIVI